MIGKKRLFVGVALPALGLLLANLTASAPAQAAACKGAVNTANSTTCAGGETDDLLTYPGTFPDYVQGAFTLRLDNHVADGIVLEGIKGGDGEIILQNGSEVTFRGITASADDDGNDLAIHVVGASSVGSGGAAADGINASALSGGDISINVRDNSLVSASVDGIEATSATGEIRIFTEAGTGIEGSAGTQAGAGIRAESLAAGLIVVTAEGSVIGADGIVADGGTVTVTTGVNAIRGTDGDGIRAHAVDLVNVTANGNVTGLTSGIEATNLAGDGLFVTTAAGTTVRGTNGQGILALALFGNIAVRADGDVIGGNDDGIQAIANGSVSVITGASVVRGAGNGIDAGGTDGVTVETGDNSTVEGGSNGIEATSAGPAGGGAITVTTGVNSRVTGADVGAGIFAETAGAITINAGGGVNSFIGGGTGIHALTSGAATVTVGADTNIAGRTGSGINASSTGGAVSISTEARSSVIGAAGDGIQAHALGDVTVIAGGNVTGAVSGIFAASTSGDVAITTNAGFVVRGGSCGAGCLGGPGIEATTTGDRGIEITNNGQTIGSTGGIAVSGATIQITNGLTGLIGNSSEDDADLAIRTVGGAATIDNAGFIRGRIVTGGGDDVLANGFFWITEGTSDFSDGSDAVNNTLGGVIRAGKDTGVADTTSFVSLEALNNAGVIELVDQAAGDGSNFSDRLETSGNYTGLGNAVLAVDASLGGTGSVSDVLVVGGNTSGVTRIVVNNTSLEPGALNTDGILVVDVEGIADADDFVLANGPIDVGFFIYDLIFNDVDNQFLLVSEADAEVFQPLAAVASSQEIWLETAGVWEARQQTLRDRLGTGVVVTAVADPALPGSVEPENGLWFQALGSWTARNSEISGLDVSYDQSVYGFVAGADFGVDLGDDATLLFGVLAGYIDSSLNFDANATSIKTDGATLGVYASLLDGGFFANVLIQADLLNMNFSDPALLFDTSDDADVTSIGARADIGYRFDEGDLFIEPMLSLAAVSTSVDEFSVGGADIDPGTNDSFRAGAGLRLGLAGERATASLTGRVWNVFAADNEVTFTAGETVLALADDTSEGLYGEVSGQIDVDLTSGTLFFVKGGVLFSDDITKPSVTGGLNFTW